MAEINEANVGPDGIDAVTLPFGQGTRLPRAWFNPAWLSRSPDWRRFELVYDGGEKFIFSKDPITLFSHERESQRSVIDRQRRAYYRNHAEAIVSLKSDAIFQPQVSRGLEGDADFEAFLHDVDLRGTNADPFFLELGRWAMVYGQQWAGITIPAAPDLAAVAARAGRTVSAAEAAAAALRPFYYQLSPLSVIDWLEDERGQLEYVVVVEEEVRRQPLGSREDAKTRTVLRVLTKTSIERFAVSASGEKTSLGVRAHPFGEVPLVPVRIRKDGRSQLEDIARLAIGVFNLDSMANEQAARQTFNQLVLKLSDPEKGMALISGTDQVLPLKQDDSAEYLAPDVNTIAALRDMAQELIDEMWAIAHLRGRPGGGKGAQPAVDVSGVAYAYEWKAAETDLFGIALALEEADLKLGRMRARVMNLDPAKYRAAYPREFDIRALMSRAAEAKAVLALQPGATAAAELRKGVVRKALPRLDAEKLATIDGEIEELSQREADRAAAPPVAPNTPPNQGMLPPGTGAGEERVARAAKADSAGTAEETST